MLGGVVLHMGQAGVQIDAAKHLISLWGLWENVADLSLFFVHIQHRDTPDGAFIALLSASPGEEDSLIQNQAEFFSLRAALLHMGQKSPLQGGIIKYTLCHIFLLFLYLYLLKQLGIVNLQLKLKPQKFGGLAAHEHPGEENFKIIHHTADGIVQLQSHVNDFLLRINLKV